MNYTCPSQPSNKSADPLGGHQVWEVALILLVTGPLSFITILGNLLVLISFRVNTHLRTVSNYYLLSLAVADLILGMVSMNLYTAYIIMGHWVLGRLACDLWLALDYVASNASVMNLLVISFDRYFSVTRPLTYRARRTPKRAALLIALAWVVSFVLWAPAILLWPHGAQQPLTTEEEVKDCSIPFLTEPSLTFGTAIAAFYLPASVMVVLYCRIYWEIENRAKGLGKFMGSVSSSKGNSVRADKPSTIHQNSDLNRPCCSPDGTSRTGPRQAWRASVGCFPGRTSDLETGNTHMHPAPEEFTYKETSSGSSWNVDENDDATTSSFTEEEQEQGLQGTPESASNPAVIWLKDLQGSSGHRQETPAPDGELTDLTAGQHSSPLSPKCGIRDTDISLRKQPKVKWRINTIIREKKAARMLSAILLAFILTWTPYNIMVLASVSYRVPEKLWQLGYWLCYVNSTVNPMCYALSNESFRTTFKALLMFRHSTNRRWGGGRHSQHVSVQDRSCSAV